VLSDALSVEVLEIGLFTIKVQRKNISINYSLLAAQFQD
jgi:hypothetical protein